MAIDIHAILRSNKASILCIDQGITHGPRVFSQHTIDPDFVLKIALEAEMTGVVLSPGIAEKYYHGAYKDIPLIIKVNGASSLDILNPQAGQFCSVEHAIKLGADAIGFTLYDGTITSAETIEEFGAVVEEAHAYGVPVVAWVYPRTDEAHDTDTIAYAARMALELGADFVKIKHPHDPAGIPWIVASAGKTRVLGADVEGLSEQELLVYTKQLMDAGATGIAFGSSVWQHPRPYALLRALHGIVFEGRSIEDVQMHLQ